MSAYYLTPEQVSGGFTITGVVDHPEYDYAYLFITGIDGAEQCVVYTYPPEDSREIEALQFIPPARASFSEGRLLLSRSA